MTNKIYNRVVDNKKKNQSVTSRDALPERFATKIQTGLRSSVKGSETGSFLVPALGQSYAY